MEGYSVTEAASVLGVPTERVWELLARGVLAGTPEGDTGMRVFLQPRPAPVRAEPAPPNGNEGDEPQRELSPFRELLTEFRNLTERYGQALLALGEARGEVAALRSRVDLLEARMDLRLPPGGSTGPTPAWTQPMPWSAPRPEADAPRPAAAASEVTTEPRSATADEAEPHADTEPRSQRRDSPRRATESFAEALARAQDPSAPELPGGPEAAAALSALRDVPTEDASAPEAALPRELPPADEVPVAEEGTSEDEAAPAEVVTTADQPETLEEPETLDEPETLEEPVGAASVGDDDAVAVVETEAQADDAGSEAASAAGTPDDRPAWQDERYTADIGEPDWWEAEALPVAATAEPPPTEDGGSTDDAPAGGGEADAVEASQVAAPEAEERVDGAAEGGHAPSSPDAGIETAGPPQPSGTLTRLRRMPSPPDEETVLWFGRSPEPVEPAEGEEVADADGDDDPGNDGDDGEEMEIAPTQGPRPLDDALAALEELSRATPPPAGAGQPGRLGVEDQSDAATSATERVRRQPPTPAGRAYRRLRRIFPN